MDEARSWTRNSLHCSSKLEVSIRRGALEEHVLDVAEHAEPNVGTPANENEKGRQQCCYGCLGHVAL